MSEPKFTVGQWRVRAEDGPPATDVMVGERLLATAYPEHFKLADPSGFGSADAILRSYAEAEVNARLIAAAPELYEALNDILRIARAATMHSGGDHNRKRIAKAEAALAKARGDA